MESDVEDGDDDVESFNESNAQTTEDAITTESPEPGLPTSKPISERNGTEGKKKKSTKRQPNSTGEMESLGTMASTATKILTQLANKKAKVESLAEPPVVADKDRDFCNFLYHKIKEVPEGDKKEDMMLQLQQVIADTRRRCRDNVMGFVGQSLQNQSLPGVTGIGRAMGYPYIPYMATPSIMQVQASCSTSSLPVSSFLQQVGDTIRSETVCQTQTDRMNCSSVGISNESFQCLLAHGSNDSALESSPTYHNL